MAAPPPSTCPPSPSDSRQVAGRGQTYVKSYMICRAGGRRSRAGDRGPRGDREEMRGPDERGNPEMTDLYIGGSWRPAADGAEFVTVDPADGSVITGCAEAGGAAVDEAVAAATAALHRPAWAQMPAHTRPRLPWRVADLSEEH